MDIKKLTLAAVFLKIKLFLFYLCNFFKYKKLGSNAYIIKPLRLNGRQYMSIGRNVRVQAFSWLIALKIDEYDPELIIGEGCAIGDFNHIAAVRRVVFGKNVLTANGVYISDNLHGFDDIQMPIMHQPVRFKAEVSIGDGSWVGENACIIGAAIGKNCVIGANAVVTSDIPDFSVAAGAPARVIKRFNLNKNSWEPVQ